MRSVDGYIVKNPQKQISIYIVRKPPAKATGVVIAQSAYQGYFSSSFSDYKVVYGKCENCNFFSLFCQPALLHIMT